jgi:hypothetical protein
MAHRHATSHNELKMLHIKNIISRGKRVTQTAGITIIRGGSDEDR